MAGLMVTVTTAIKVVIENTLHQDIGTGLTGIFVLAILFLSTGCTG